MKLSMALNYSGGFKESVQRIVDLEKAGLDVVWIAEAYSFDAVSQVGYLAAKTERIEIGTGILNVYSRTPALMAMTAAGCDYVSDGRFILGLGASGPQVVEGFHGMPYEKPMVRIKEYIESCRMIWKREEKFEFHGQTVDVPLPAGEGTGLGKPLKIINPGDRPVRPDIPIWWASLMGLSVTATAQHADGWLPIFFDPDKFHQVWGDELKAGVAKRDPALGPLQISAGGMLAIDENLTGEARDRILDFARPQTALYVGGMGARDKNFYNTICKKYGYEKEAIEIQDLYLDGKKDEAAKAVPGEMLEHTNLIGPKSYIKERLAAYKEAGVTILSVQGPRSRELLQPLTDTDLSNDSFPYLTGKDTHVGNAAVWVSRVTYVGELGFELHVPTDQAAGLYDLLIAEGAPLGIRPVGLAAMASLRLEKGYRAWAADITPEETPYEAGLGPFVRMKKGEFVGRAALERREAARARLGLPADRFVDTQWCSQ